jgi:hypothetical protein
MAEPPQNRHYPSRQVTGKLHDDFRILYDHVYALTDRLAAAHKEIADMKSKHSDLARQVAGGPSTTKIAGLYVKGSVPNDADRLTYDAKSGQIVWKP